MKKHSKVSLTAIVLLILSLPAYAGVTVSVSPVGTTNDFPSKPIYTGVGTLGADSSNPSGAVGLTIQGGVVNGVPAGKATGEIVRWSGANSTLNSIDFVTTGSGGNGVYQVFLFDLGTNLFF